jgi:hypothetical protein
MWSARSVRGVTAQIAGTAAIVGTAVTVGIGAIVGTVPSEVSVVSTGIDGIVFAEIESREQKGAQVPFCVLAIFPPGKR